MFFADSLEDLWQRHRVTFLIAVFALVFLFIWMLPRVLIFVQAGHAGVRFARLGGGVRTDLVFGEGTHCMLPWDTVTIYDIRVSQVESVFSVLTNNGLSIQLDISIRYFPKPEYLGFLHKEIGPDYVEKIVIPEVQATVRKIFGEYTPEMIYRTQSDLILAVSGEASHQLDDRFIVLDKLLIRSVQLPPNIQSAIQAKLVAEQAAQEMKFRIDRELREKERKTIEAEGVATYNKTLGDSLGATPITENILRHKGIEALLEVAKYANSNTLIYGNSGNLPFFVMPPAGAASVPASVPAGVPVAPPSAPPSAPAAAPGLTFDPTTAREAPLAGSIGRLQSPISSSIVVPSALPPGR